MLDFDDNEYIGKMPSGGGGGGGGSYQLHRVKDDNNVEIGTAFMEFTDGNGNKFDVVCLDAQYRVSSAQYCNNNSSVITDLPTYQDQTIYSSTDTATFNTQKIIDFCTAQSATSNACSRCRSKSFTINGVTYYGQLPNIVELIEIFKKRIEINSYDTSPSGYSYLLIPTASRAWSSNQWDAFYSWAINKYGLISNSNKSDNCLVFPVLEIPKS